MEPTIITGRRDFIVPILYQILLVIKSNSITSFHPFVALSSILHSFAAMTAGSFLQNAFSDTRSLTETLCKTLATEDYCIQSMPDVSPPKWHLAHTTWFFDRFALSRNGCSTVNPVYDFLFNSYYETVGPFFERAKRGDLSRPLVREIYEYRSLINESILHLLNEGDENPETARRRAIVELGIHHEQQHQELLLTDVLYNFWKNPLRPAFLPNQSEKPRSSHSSPLNWISFEGGMVSLGFSETREPSRSQSHSPFSFDHERPAHPVFVAPFSLASRLTTQGEFLDFVEEGGYRRPELWLSDGWNYVQTGNWTAPLYWEKKDGEWGEMTLYGMQPLRLNAPVSHLSFFEAAAFALWKKKRLPTEAEWELAARTLPIPITGNLLETQAYCPLPSTSEKKLDQMYGDVWEWTQSPYLPYPGFQPLQGSLGEYNGKFMCNQMVLRGGSFATSIHHIRPSYRNFFAPHTRWQFAGLRLANDLG